MENNTTRPRGGLKEFSLADMFDTSQVDIHDDISGFSLESPLQAVSPNLVALKQEKEGPTKPANATNQPPIVDESNCSLVGMKGSEDVVAPLPSFARKKIDPRRQSTAIFSAFEESSSGAGLLGDAELAVCPDEDLLIPLAKSSKAMASKGNSTLWVDPDTDEILNGDLPELSSLPTEAARMPLPPIDELDGGVALNRSAASQPDVRQTRSGRNTGGVRDSIAVFAGFARALEGPGFEGEDENEDAAFLSGTLAQLPEEIEPAAPSASAQPPILDSYKETKQSEAPKQRMSRLRPPSSSSSYFSNTAASNKAPAPPRAKGPPLEQPPLPPVEKRPPSSAQTAPLRKHIEQPKPKVVVESKKSVPIPKTHVQKVEAAPLSKGVSVPQSQPAQPRPSRLGPSRLPAPPSLKPAQPKPSSIPAPKIKSAAAPPAKPRIQASAAAAVTPVSKKSAAAGPVAVQRFSPSPGAGAKEDTPRTAHLRWLEEHPELAFGGGPKIANSPGVQEEPRRKTAEDAHYEAWGKDLTAL